jgi:hypothetical protein
MTQLFNYQAWYRKLAGEYPEFLTSRGIEKIRKEHGCHFAAIFDNASKSILDKYKVDRKGNPRGFVKLDLKDIELYDQK